LAANNRWTSLRSDTTGQLSRKGWRGRWDWDDEESNRYDFDRKQMTSRKADWGKRTAKKTPGTTVVLDDVVSVPVSPDQAWIKVSDAQFVASCLPGVDTATLTEEQPNVFRARMVNSVMGIDANWDLKATILPDEVARSLKVVFDGRDTRLNMKMDGDANVVVRPDEGGAALDYDGNIRVDGSLAAMGGPIIRTIIRDSLDEFIAAVGGQESAKRMSWFARVRRLLRERWGRLFGRRTGAETRR
jgi:carbon monoxide dehydrogenase subunit G